MSKSAQSDVTSEINKKADKEIEKQFGDYYKKENLEKIMGFCSLPKPLPPRKAPKPKKPYVSKFEKYEKVYFQRNPPLAKPYEEKLLPVFEDTIKWLDIYFGGAVPDFTPELSIHSTPFREAVWDILLTIPYGQTITYGEIAANLAHQMGKKKMSAQAVGGAVGHNPISIIIPCHRVVGADGSLTGYAGGLKRKQFLLDIERN